MRTVTVIQICLFFGSLIVLFLSQSKTAVSIAGLILGFTLIWTILSNHEYETMFFNQPQETKEEGEEDND